MIAPPAVTLPVKRPVAAMRPVQSIVERTATGLRLRLIGRSERAIAIRYLLATRGRGNRVTQGGSARLEPGRSVILFDITQSAGDDWSATLDVTIDGGEGYREALRPPAPDPYA